jgi:hypothetical protein
MCSDKYLRNSGTRREARDFTLLDKDAPSRDSWLIDPKSVAISTLLRSADNGYSYDAFSDDPTAVQSEVWDRVKERPDQHRSGDFFTPGTT